MSDAPAGSIVRGRCLCGAVAYEVRGRVRAIALCHCGMCRRAHSYVGAYTEAERDAVTVEDRGALRWYRSSERVRRGFCGECGSILFWDCEGTEHLGLAAGALDVPEGVRAVCHIHVASKAGWYELADDGLRRFDGDP